MQRIAIVSVIAAVGLVAAKLVVGLTSGSLAVLAEAGHSSVDLLAAIVSLVAVRIAARPADEDHHYGHGKAQELAGLAEGGFLIALAVVTLGEAIHRLVDHVEPRTDGWFVLVFVGIIVVDLSRWLVLRRAARRYRSPAFEASATHFLTDMIASTAVLVALGLSAIGVDRVDPIASLAVVAVMVVSGIRLIRRNAQRLMDVADPEAVRAVEAALADVEVDRLRVRQAADRVFVDLVVKVDPERPTAGGHAEADRIEALVLDAIDDADVVVHVEPGDADARGRVVAAASEVEGVAEVHNVQIVDGERRLVSLHVKLPPDLSLAAAHERADEVEARVAEATGIDDVHLHLEPLDGPCEAVDETGYDEILVEETVRATGHRPREWHVYRSAAGLHALVVVLVDADLSLHDAHEAAGRLERRVRDRAPDLTDVHVHTEPIDPYRSTDTVDP